MGDAGDTTADERDARLRNAAGKKPAWPGDASHTGAVPIAPYTAHPTSLAPEASHARFGGLAYAGMLIGWIAGVALQLQQTALARDRNH